MQNAITMRTPIIELSECILCGICTEVCPLVFSENKMGYIQVAELSNYPENEVNEAIKNCPTKCISWGLPLSV